jgi:RimJ/RimL family protein N-acetyltransferase
VVLKPKYPIETERLLLRPHTDDDFGDFLALQSSPDVVRWLPWGVRDPDEIRAVLEKKKRASAIEREDQGLSLVVVRRDEEGLIGEASLEWRSEEHSQGEVGFIIHPDHQGMGYATEAAAAMLELGFEGLGLHRIYGRAEARNDGSMGVMERLGMRREAHLVENEFRNGEWESEVICAILAPEWRSRRAAPDA